MKSTLYITIFIFSCYINNRSVCNDADVSNRCIGHYVASNFDLKELKRKGVDYKLHNYAEKIGSGFLSVIHSIKLRHQEKDIIKGVFPTFVVKTLEKQPNEYENIMEIKINRFIANKYPLYFSIYFGCAATPNDSDTTIYLFMEELDTLKNATMLKYMQKLMVDEQKKLNKIPLVNDQRDLRWLEVPIGLLLMLATEVSILHHNNIIHYDIKPANLVVKNGKTPAIKLIDFGLALDLDVWVKEHPTKATKVRGTSLYIDPYIYGNHPPNKLSDAFSMGITFIKLIYEGSNLFGTVFRMISPGKTKLKGINYNTPMGKYNVLLSRLQEPEQPVCIAMCNSVMYFMCQVKINEVNDIIRITNELILHLTTPEIDNRASANQAMKLLNYLLREINPDSLYLTKNSSRLYQSLYPKDIYNIINSKEMHLTQEDIDSEDFIEESKFIFGKPVGNYKDCMTTRGPFNSTIVSEDKDSKESDFFTDL